jgi:hypothetical protein
MHMVHLHMLAGFSILVRRAAQLFSVVCVLAALTPPPTLAQANVTLAWDPSPDPNVTGYNVYYGVQSRSYTNFLILGNTNSVVISNLANGTIYYFAATTVNSVGLESDFSAEASYFVRPSGGDQAPTLDPINSVTFNQDSGPQLVQLTGISSGTTNIVALNITATSSDTNLVSSLVVNYTNLDTTAALTLVSGPNLFGTATVTVTVDNGQPTNNTVSQSFIVTVLQTNNTWAMWWQHTDGYVATWLMQGTNCLAPVRLSTPPASPGWQIVGTGDFEGNGQQDLLWQHTAGWVAVWFMNGTNFTGRARLNSTPVSPGWNIVATGDIDGDGHTDILWQNGGWAAVWFMDGTNYTGMAHLNTTPVDPGWRIAGTGHFRDTNHTDIVWQNASGWVALWLMDHTNCTGRIHLNSVSAGSGWKLVGTADINGDGNVDLVFQNSTGPAAYWLMNGTNFVSATRFNKLNLNPAWRVVGPH